MRYAYFKHCLHRRRATMDFFIVLRLTLYTMSVRRDTWRLENQRATVEKICCRRVTRAPFYHSIDCFFLPALVCRHINTQPRSPISPSRWSLSFSAVVDTLRHVHCSVWKTRYFLSLLEEDPCGFTLTTVARLGSVVLFKAACSPWSRSPNLFENMGSFHLSTLPQQMDCMLVANHRYLFCFIKFLWFYCVWMFG